MPLGECIPHKAGIATDLMGVNYTFRRKV